MTTGRHDRRSANRACSHFFPNPLDWVQQQCAVDAPHYIGWQMGGGDTPQTMGCNHHRTVLVQHRFADGPNSGGPGWRNPVVLLHPHRTAPLLGPLALPMPGAEIAPTGNNDKGESQHVQRRLVNGALCRQPPHYRHQSVDLFKRVVERQRRPNRGLHPEAA